MRNFFFINIMILQFIIGNLIKFYNGKIKIVNHKKLTLIIKNTINNPLVL